MTLQAALLAPSGRSDDLETLLLSQSLEWGYEAKNPPAFYWLAWGATVLFGPSLPVIYGLRLAGVFAGFARALRDRTPGPARPAARRLRRARDARDPAFPLVPAQLPDQYLVRPGAGAARGARAPAPARPPRLGRLRAPRRAARARDAHPLQLRDLRRRARHGGAVGPGLARPPAPAAGARDGSGRPADAGAPRRLGRRALGGAERPGAEPDRRRRGAALSRAGGRGPREPRRGGGQHPYRPARHSRRPSASRAPSGRSRSPIPGAPPTSRSSAGWCSPASA